MLSRRRFLKVVVGAGASLGAVLTPVWMEHLVRSRRAAAQQVPDNRPLVFNLDAGRVLAITDERLLIRSGLGLGERTLHVQPNCRILFEGKESSFDRNLVQVGDLVNASGETLDDKSLNLRYLTINPMPNLLGVVHKTVGTNLLVFARAGRERGEYQTEAIEIQTTPKTDVFVGRGNFSNPNGRLTDAKAGSAVQVDGYFTRSGDRVAMKVFLFNQLPPDDIPDWLLLKVQS